LYTDRPSIVWNHCLKNILWKRASKRLCEIIRLCESRKARYAWRKDTLHHTFSIIYPSLGLHSWLLTDLMTAAIEKCMVNTTNSFTKVNKGSWGLWPNNRHNQLHRCHPYQRRKSVLRKSAKARFPNAIIIAAGESCGCTGGNIGRTGRWKARAFGVVRSIKVERRGRNVGGKDICAG